MICIDTHLHFYESYDAEAFLKNLINNLESLCSGCEKAGVVLDRAGEKAFDALRDKAMSLDGNKEHESKEIIEYKGETGAVKLYRGVQVACEERFEVLGLFCSLDFKDGIEAVDAIGEIKAAGGLPVLAWAPGKWMFGRRLLAQSILKESGEQGLFVGDTSLRPTIWREPVLMREFRKAGGKVLCGSDPLPFKGQESIVGSYASKVKPDDGVDVTDALRRCLASDQVGLGTAGRRASTIAFASRMIKHKFTA